MRDATSCQYELLLTTHDLIAIPKCQKSETKSGEAQEPKQKQKIVKRTRLFKNFFSLIQLDSTFSQSGNWLRYLAFTVEPAIV